MNELISSSSPLVVGGSSTLDFVPHSDLTYRLYDNQTIDGRDVTRSLLIGTYFRHCRFENSKFDNCDIEAAQFIGCSFVNCSFLDADIRSCVFTRCTVDVCRFDRALLQDLSAQQTAFNNSSFAQATIHDGVFFESAFDGCSIKSSSALHNKFTSVHFKRMRIADCTFLYSLFIQCAFTEVQMNVEAIGPSFGLSNADVQSLDLIYLGEIQQKPPKDLIDALRLSYHERKWAFSEAMLGVSFGPQHRLVALTEAINVLIRLAISGIGVKRDEFRFLARVSEFLAEHGRLPLNFLSQAIETTGEALDRTDVAQSNSGKAIQELHNHLFLLTQRALEDYHRVVAEIATGDELSSTVLATLTYIERPQVDSALTIRFAGQAATEGGLVDAQLVEARSGSWVELVQTTVLGVIALYSLLAATNGVLIQIIRARALTKALVQPIPKRMVQGLIRKSVLSNDMTTPGSRAAQAALGLLSTHTKGAPNQVINAHLNAAVDLEKLRSISLDEGNGKSDRQASR